MLIRRNDHRVDPLRAGSVLDDPVERYQELIGTGELPLIAELSELTALLSTVHRS